MQYLGFKVSLIRSVYLCLFTSCQPCYFFILPHSSICSVYVCRNGQEPGSWRHWAGYPTPPPRAAGGPGARQHRQTEMPWASGYVRVSSASDSASIITSHDCVNHWTSFSHQPCLRRRGQPTDSRLKNLLNRSASYRVSLQTLTHISAVFWLHRFIKWI